MTELLILCFGISLPIFYLRGMWAFFQGGNHRKIEKAYDESIADFRRKLKRLEVNLIEEQAKRRELESQLREEQQKRHELENQLEEEQQFQQELENRLEIEPEVTLQTIFDEYFEPPEQPSEVFETTESIATDEEFLQESAIQASDGVDQDSLANEAYTTIPTSTLEGIEISIPLSEEDVFPEANPIATIDDLISADNQPIIEDDAIQIIDEEPQAQSPEFIEAETKRKEGFNWRNWYADNAINVFLFLGAFLVVAAVSFFISIQWGNLSGLARFGIVVAFTGAWYVAGFAFNRGEAFKTVGITFITIGSILMPFCGIAYQQLVIGSMDGVGITWLATSVFSTLSYMILSLIFRRRYFTYFGTLSILAMILALVRVGNAPQKIFILAGTITALILLVGRITLRYFPLLDDYMGQDYENSSVGTLLLSLAVGFILLPTQGIPLFSIEVTIVGASAAIYLWVYASLHHAQAINRYWLAAQVLTTLIIAHGAISLGLDAASILAWMLAAQLIMQIILHFAYRNHPEQLLFSHQISLGTTGIIYLASIPLVPLNLIVSLIFALVAMAQLSYYALRFNQTILFYGVVGLSYAALWHGLATLGVAQPLWGYAFLTLGILEVIVAYFIPYGYFRDALTYLGFGVIAVSGAMGYLFVESSTTIQPYLLSSVSIIFFIAFIYIDKPEHERIDSTQSYLLSLGISAGYYLLSYIAPLPLFQAVLLALVALHAYVIYRRMENPLLLYAIASSFYVLLWHVLAAFNIGIELWGSAFTLLAAGQILILYRPFDDDWREAFAYVGLFGLAAGAAGGMLVEISSLAILTSFAAIIIYGVVSHLEYNREELFLNPYIHLVGIVTTLFITLLSLPNLESQIDALLTTGFILGAIALLLLAYRHIAQTLYIIASAVLGYFAVAFFLTSLAIPIQFFALPFVLYSVGLLALRFIPLNKQILTTTANIGMIGLAVSSIWMTLTGIFYPEITMAFSVAIPIMFFALVIYGVVSHIEYQDEEPLLNPYMHLIGIVPAFAICGDILLRADLGQFYFPITGFFIGMIVLLLLAYRHITHNEYIVTSSVLGYFVLAFLFAGLGIQIEYFALPFVIYSVCLLALRYLPLNKQILTTTANIGMVGLTVGGLWITLIHAGDAPSAMLASSIIPIGFIVLIIYGVVSHLEYKHEDPLLNPYMHLMGLIPAFFICVDILQRSNWIQFQLPVTGFIVAAIILMLLAYRHIEQLLLIIASTILGYVALGFLFAGLGTQIQYFALPFVIYSACLLGLCLLPVNRPIQMTTVSIGIIGLSSWMIMGWVAISLSQNLTSNFIAIWFALGAAFVFGEYQRRNENVLAHEIFNLLPTISLILIYIWSLNTDLTRVSLFFALALIVLMVQHYWRTRHKGFVFGVIIMIYAALINLLFALDVPYATFPIAISLLSIILFAARSLFVSEADQPLLNLLIMVVLGITSIFSLEVSMTDNLAIMHLSGWVSAYTLLGIFWQSKLIPDELAHDFIFAVLAYGLYLWHIFYGVQYINPTLFNNMQWILVGFGVGVLALGLRQANRQEGHITTNVLLLSAAIFLLPTYYQSMTSGLLFTGLAIAYSLIFVVIGILYRNSISQLVGVSGVVIAILIPTGNFLLNLPIWIFVLIIGLSLIGVAVFLTVRRRNLKKPELTSIQQDTELT